MPELFGGWSALGGLTASAAFGIGLSVVQLAKITGLFSAQTDDSVAVSVGLDSDTLSLFGGLGNESNAFSGRSEMSTKPTVFARLAEAIPSKVLRRIFFGSVAVNVIIAGFMIGDGLFSGPPRGPRAVEMTLGPIARALAEDDRRLILESLRGNPALAPFGRRDHATDVGALVAALQTDPFDAEQVRAAIEAQSAKVSDAQRIVQAAVLYRLAAMSPEERAAFVERLQDD